jgi:hypothetical protein
MVSKNVYNDRSFFIFKIIIKGFMQKRKFEKLIHVNILASKCQGHQRFEVLPSFFQYFILIYNVDVDYMIT